MLINFLAYTVGVPILVGIICLFIPEKLKILTKTLAFITALIIFTASIRIFIFKPLYWPPVPTPIFTVDNLSGLACIGVSFFAVLITLYSFSFIEKDTSKYFSYVLMTLGSALGAVFSNNFIMLLIFWGMLAALLYLLVSIQGTDKAAASAKKSMIIIGGTDAFMILGIGLIWKLTGTFVMDKVHIELSGALSYIALLSIVIASFAKAGVVPFHSWLPDVAEDGPASVTAYLPASLDKLLGIYLLARAALNLFVMNNIANLILLIIGSITIIYAVGIALFQHDFKRLLGYHAVSQVGYMVLGIGTANPIGIAGGLFHMLNNAIYKSCLFLSAGAVEKRAHTTDLTKLGGIAKFMPITFICFFIASLSISGILPFNGFVSKWMVYQGIIELATNKNPLWIIWLVAAMFGSALTVASFMKLLHAVFLGRRMDSIEGLREVNISMTLPMIILAITCVVFGIFAFAIPLSLFILPAIGREAIQYLGVWNPAIAAGLILIGILAGIVMYMLAMPKKSRSVGVFIGGEDPDTLERVTGAEFYDTIKDLKILRSIYAKEEAHDLDIYDGGKKLVSFFTEILQKLHNGILPTYLVWCLLGMIGIFLILFLR
jgi:formate hydrogenlyase subunit 3/multisubunit Na+/H+ antiporter MnhD subunit